MHTKLLIIAVFIVIQFKCTLLYSQLPDPITRSTTEFGIVNSDYGPRHFATSPFHNGGLLPLSDTL